MPPMVSQIEVARPPDEVFAYATDPSRFAEWQDDVVRVHIPGGRPPSVGSRFTTTRRIGGVEYGYTQEITEVNPPRSWAVRGVDGPFRPSADITVEPLDGGTRSRVTFALDFQGRGIAKLLTLDVIRRMALKQAPRSYRNLKERLERGDRRALGSAGATRPRKRRAV
jgi:carbon monoxide dehydrogenase subunit G